MYSMHRLNQSLRVQIYHLYGLLWPLKGLPQEGEGTGVGAIHLMFDAATHRKKECRQ
jgi:hypothetical protein